MRCFVAVDLSDAVRGALGDVQRRMREEADGADVRWVAMANAHLTLKFLGQVDETRRDELVLALGRAVAGCPPIGLEARGMGAFPSVRRARVVWAAITTGAAELVCLAASVDAAFAPLGFPAEQRPFTAHITLGRVRSPRGLARLGEAIERARDADVGRWSVDRVVLYRSHLRPRGAVYEALAHLALAGSST